MGHDAHHHHHHDSVEIDWVAMAAQLELEAEVMLPFVTETAVTAAELCRQDGLAVQRILDVGSGPGVVACELATRFPLATVIAADATEPLLQRAATRAAGLGLSERVITRAVELPGGIEQLGRADLIWMAMVLHHVGDEADMLRRVRHVVEPGGILVLVEHGDPMRFLSEDSFPSRTGLNDRLDALEASWLAAMRAELPNAVDSTDYATMLEAAGFEVIVDRVAHVQIRPPLPLEARRMILGRLQRARDLFAEQLEEGDGQALDVLIAEEHPLGVMRHPEVFLDASRHVYTARAR